MPSKPVKFAIFFLGAAVDVWAIVQWSGERLLPLTLGPPEYGAILVLGTGLAAWATHKPAIKFFQFLQSRCTETGRFRLLAPEIQRLEERLMSRAGFTRIRESDQEAWNVIISKLHNFRIYPRTNLEYGECADWLHHIGSYAASGDLESSRQLAQMPNDRDHHPDAQEKKEREG